MMEVKLKKIEYFDVLAIQHIGSYMNIGNAFEKLFGWLGIRGLIGPELGSVGIDYSDPDAVAENELKSFACVALPNMNNIELDVPPADLLPDIYMPLKAQYFFN